jgi:hypothetical protein
MLDVGEVEVKNENETLSLVISNHSGSWKYDVNIDYVEIMWMGDPKL